MRAGRRRMAFQTPQVVPKDTPRHRCAVCGITNKTHPQMMFRYCSKCAGAQCYCEEHLNNHPHIQRTEE